MAVNISNERRTDPHGTYVPKRDVMVTDLCRQRNFGCIYWLFTLLTVHSVLHCSFAQSAVKQCPTELYYMAYIHRYNLTHTALFKTTLVWSMHWHCCTLLTNNYKQLVCLSNQHYIAGLACSIDPYNCLNLTLT